MRDFSAILAHQSTAWFYIIWLQIPFQPQSGENLHITVFLKEFLHIWLPFGEFETTPLLEEKRLCWGDSASLMFFCRVQKVFHTKIAFNKFRILRELYFTVCDYTLWCKNGTCRRIFRPKYMTIILICWSTIGSIFSPYKMKKLGFLCRNFHIEEHSFNVCALPKKNFPRNPNIIPMIFCKQSGQMKRLLFKEFASNPLAALQTRLTFPGLRA